MSSHFEEALSNIDVFCSVLVRKMTENKEPQVKPEIIENMLRRKHDVKIHGDFRRAEDLLIDVFEDERQVKVLMQCLHTKRKVELYPRGDCTEIWVDKGQKVRIPINSPDINRTTIKWNNNVLEITIPK